MDDQQFEFTPKQDIEFRELVAKEKIAAIAIAALMTLKLVSRAGSIGSAGWQEILFAVASFIAGIYSCCALFRSGQKLYRITQSNGKDLRYLFAGLQQLENFFAAIALAILFDIIPNFLAS
jgi:hypothetical protein